MHLLSDVHVFMYFCGSRPRPGLAAQVAAKSCDKFFYPFQDRVADGVFFHQQLMAAAGMFAGNSASTFFPPVPMVPPYAPAPASPIHVFRPLLAGRGGNAAAAPGRRHV